MALPFGQARRVTNDAKRAPDGKIQGVASVLVVLLLASLGFQDTLSLLFPSRTQGSHR